MKFYTPPKKIELTNSLLRDLVLTERQFILLSDWIDVSKWRSYRFGKHNSQEDITTLEGYTESFLFEDVGMKREFEIDLLQNYTNSIFLDGALRKSPKKDISLERVRSLAGSDELFEEMSFVVNDSFDYLNKKGLNYIVFRSYRNYPAFWDSICCYSIGDFKEISFDSILEKIKRGRK